MADETGRIIFAVVLIIICLVALLCNIFVFFTCAKRRRLRRPFRYFLISLAVSDILAVGLWSSLTIVSILSNEWIFPTSLCNVHEYFRTLFLLINMHSFGILAIERCIYFFKPSKHSEIFINTVVFIMIVALWVFDAIMAVLPFANWGEVTYFANQYQCSMNYPENVRHMNFMTALTFGIPFVVCLVVYVAIFVRLRKLKKEASQEGGIILEVNSFAKGDSYSHRLKIQQMKFQNAGMKKRKPQIGKKLSFTNDGYVSNDSSDDEIPTDSAGYVAPKDTKQKRIHYLSKNDLELIKTYIIMTVTYAICWLPYVIVMYVITYHRFASIPDELITSLVLLTHASLFVKPLVYVLYNSYFRSNFKKSFKKEKYQTFDKRPKDGDTENPGEEAETKDKGIEGL